MPNTARSGRKSSWEDMMHPKQNNRLGELNSRRMGKFSGGNVGGGHSRYRHVIKTAQGAFFVGKKGQDAKSLMKEWGIKEPDVADRARIRRGPGSAYATSDKVSSPSTFFHHPRNSARMRAFVENMIKEYHPKAKFTDEFLSGYRPKMNASR